MMFHSPEFIAFFALFYAVYLRSGARARNSLLLAASYFFYATWDWRFPALLFASTAASYFAAIRIEESSGAARRRILAAVLVFHLLLLGFFKYFRFFADNASGILGAFGVDAPPVALRVALPVGISFYTFQAMSYVIDVSRGACRAGRSFPDFALYMAFFTQLLAGPIERARRLLPQIAAARRITLEDFYAGVWLFALGFYQKAVLADNLSPIVNAVFAKPSDASGADTALAVYAYAFQIFCDFAGYSNMARGLGRVMGFDIFVNFRCPYFAANPSELWQRWHISLSSWLRNYLYIPLGGNRGGTWFTTRNLFITMALGGLWHGASWMFVLWGIYHGALLAGHRLWTARSGCVSLFGALPGRVRKIASIALMFHLTCFGWILFRSESLAQFGEILRGSARPGGFHLLNGGDPATLAVLLAPLLFLQWREYRGEDPAGFTRAPALARFAIYFFLMFAAAFWGGGNAKEFIYLQF